MTETQRRAVEVFATNNNFAQNYSAGELTIRPDTSEKLFIRDINRFLLVTKGDVVVASSYSDHALSGWAFKLNGVHHIRHAYDLRIGDDGR